MHELVKILFDVTGEELTKLGVELAGERFQELLAEYSFGKGLTKVAQLTHHELARSSVNKYQQPSLMYAATPLTLDTTVAVLNFLKENHATSVGLLSNDGWRVVAASRDRIPLREKFRLWVGPDFHPHLYLVMLRQSSDGTHVFSGCRYSNVMKLDVFSFYGKAAIDRAYRLLIAANVRAPITAVATYNVDTFP